jgi:hypothetical protein
VLRVHDDEISLAVVRGAGGTRSGDEAHVRVAAGALGQGTTNPLLRDPLRAVSQVPQAIPSALHLKGRP